MNSFFAVHPAVLAFYFISVLAVTMFSANPILLLCAFLGSILFLIKVQRQTFSFKSFNSFLILFLLISFTNPLFSHNGVTVLFFLNQNPVTLEAFFYGVNTAVMLIAVLLWFKVFNLTLNDDKLLFLLAKLSPKISLLVSSALRFLPLFKRQAEKLSATQKAMGLFAENTWTDKLRSAMRVYSALITWALENAIDTGSSMKARGYGLKGRSNFSNFTFRASDAVLTAVISAADAIIIAVMAVGELSFTFYPEISAKDISVYGILAIIAFFALSLLPFIIEVKGDFSWKYYRSKI